MKRMASLMVVLLLVATFTLAACHRPKAQKPNGRTGASTQPAARTTTQPGDE